MILVSKLWLVIGGSRPKAVYRGGILNDWLTLEIARLTF
ncbi:hypothetical protein [Methylomonas fluvii]|nr:hypothetical protein [Methylomonas fluvii]